MKSIFLIVLNGKNIKCSKTEFIEFLSGIDEFYRAECLTSCVQFDNGVLITTYILETKSL